MKCRNWSVGVCSWSLKTDVAGVAAAMSQMKIDHVNLSLRPALGENGTEYLDAVRCQDWTISNMTLGFAQEDYSSLETIRATGGIVPDEYWEANRNAFLQAVAITADFGVPYLSMHVGFIDEDNPDAIKKLRDRLLQLADAAGEKDITVLMETGQETAESLRDFLEGMNHSAIGVNLDPANMILYDMGDPVEAVSILAPWIKHIHIKDAIRTKQPGVWGTEVPWGDGEVGGEAFLRTLQEVGFSGALAIEREAGDDRIGDVQLAVTRLAEVGRHLELGEN